MMDALRTIHVEPGRPSLSWRIYQLRRYYCLLPMERRDGYDADLFLMQLNAILMGAPDAGAVMATAATDRILSLSYSSPL